MDWITTANGLVALATGLTSLIVAAVSAYFAVKNYLAANKEKTAAQLWATITSMADAAMKEYEAQSMTNADRKAKVIATIKAACAADGLHIEAFLDQLSAYIDNCIDFYNGMKDAENLREANEKLAAKEAAKAAKLAK